MTMIKFNSYHQKEEIKRNLELINLEHEKIREYVNFDIFSFEQLDEFQVGYSIDTDGNSLVTDEEDTWDANWIVIAYETMCGDPIIIDLNEDGYPISSLMHGMDSWGVGGFLADSMDSFINFIKDIGNFLTEKQVLEGKRIIQNRELKTLLNKFLEKNKFADFEIWHSLLSPLFDIAEEYEQTLEAKVKKMKKEGKKITEIAHLLNIKPKEVYEYIKKV
ncbi:MULTISPECIES: SMI1/KNR4 family protein [Bacillus]|uniref:SMI1/KNR4 family protein n=1 Tax=Bacillus TaxID=1386 RepID=UPI00031B6451|nr:SMI1/KNR4 family protein [Bacillus pseudomycoides]MCR8861135.1 SMI1/KNR4 family protein [Bacillus pseudomycoides]MED1625150.1 SMI1/KNR4 family protein [Bacillus pseudomycoides]PDZ70974.1 SMI1/KNR4 family protein [Bacillus pseudomycoides]PEF21244.1 SMI1/KNR4 family protein [Bacillus pseudomycoides]PFY87169.1 SMI1/KNR4 family protein [Bacillus pseudomycoides]